MNIIEQAKFSYCPLGKAFKKQTKTNQDQREKQIKATEDNKKQQDNKKELGNNELLLSNEWQTFKNIHNKRLNKIDELSKTIDYSDLKFIVNSSGLDTNFSKLKDLVAFLNSFEKCEISIEQHDINKTNLIDMLIKKSKNWK